MCARPVGQHIREDCSLCLKKDQPIRNHMARHMRSLALFVLPKVDDSSCKTLACSQRLGEIYYKQEDYTKAREIFEQLRDKEKKSRGDDDPKSLECGHHLAEIYFIQEEFAKAEIIFDRIWDERKMRLGDNNLETLASGHQLAKSIYAQVDGNEEKFFQGMGLLKSLWEARKPELKAMSPNAVTSSSCLAAVETGYMYGSLLVKCGKLPEAEEVLKPLWELKVDPAVEASQLYVGHSWSLCLTKQSHDSNAREVLEEVRRRRTLLSGPGDDS